MKATKNHMKFEIVFKGLKIFWIESMQNGGCVMFLESMQWSMFYST
jgi:hypothetical protein